MPDTIKIGTVVPFTGPEALRVNGPRMSGGAQAWLSIVNSRGGLGGRPLELIVEDSGYDIGKTQAAIRKLVEVDEVLALLNANGTPQLTAALPYLESNRVPLIVPFGGDEPWFHPPRWGVFGAQPPFAAVGTLLGRWVAEEGHRKPVVLYPHYPEISPEMASHAQKAFAESAQPESRIDAVEVKLGCEDGEAMADAIMAFEPDAIIVLVNWVELIAVQKTLNKRGVRLPLYSWTANVTQQIADRGGSLLEGMFGYSATAVGPDADLPIVQSYRDAMAQLYPDQEPDFLSLAAFAHAMIFTEALTRAGATPARDNLVNAMYSGSFQTGILPTVDFSPTRHMGATAVQPMELKGGRWMPLGAPRSLTT